MFNHTLNKIAVDFTSRTGSRKRVRVPVAGTRHIGYHPGQKVAVVASDKGGVEIFPVSDPKRYVNTYTVEKDGAIRITAEKFGLKTEDLSVTCDKLTNHVFVA